MPPSNSFGVARSGDYESWFHGPSHMWDGWLYDSAAKNTDGSYKYKGALKGGWYDCGNHLKEARTNSYPLATLGMLAATMPEKDADQYALNQSITSSTDRIPDVLREAWVGAQYVFNSWRLAKGKASDMYLSVGDLSWDFAWWGQARKPRRGVEPYSWWSKGARTQARLGISFHGRFRGGNGVLVAVVQALRQTSCRLGSCHCEGHVRDGQDREQKGRVGRLHRGQFRLRRPWTGFGCFALGDR
jgi:hypothetical protein